nr:hypothetical protein Itr_chr04CG16980 [Ipomoea trifida]
MAERRAGVEQTGNLGLKTAAAAMEVEATAAAISLDVGVFEWSQSSGIKMENMKPFCSSVSSFKKKRFFVASASISTTFPLFFRATEIDLTADTWTPSPLSLVHSLS